MYIYKYIYIYIYVQIYLSIYLSIYISIYIVNIHSHACTHPRAHTRVCIHICLQDQSSNDLLDVMLRAGANDDDIKGSRLSNEELANNVQTFLVAGHETTSTALSWYAKEPHILPKEPYCMLTENENNDICSVCTLCFGHSCVMCSLYCTLSWCVLT